MEDNDIRVSDWFLNSETRDRVRGYLQHTQACALNALLGQQTKVGLTGALAEIGVFLGKTLIGLGRASRAGETVLGVDPLMIGSQNLAPELTNNLRTHLSSAELSRLTVRRALSTQLDAMDWMQSLKQPARFIHLDCHHARETMLHDLQLAACWLQKGAVVVIDDFLNELHPDLTSGILDGLGAHLQLEPVAVIPRMGHIEEGGSKLVCATRGDGAMYRDALDRALSDHLRPWSDRMLGHEVRVYRSSLPTVRSEAPALPRAAAKPLPVVFALHEPSGAYWLNTAVALTSVAAHAGRSIHVHLLHDDSLPEIARRRLTQIAQDLRTQLTFTPVRLPPALDTRRLRQFSPASIFRLLIPSLFAEEPLVVYLDSDLVVNAVDVGELADLAPMDAPLCAVRDPHIATPTSHAEALKRLGLDADAYVNSGVLVLRPPLLKEDLLEAFSAFSEANPEAIHPDQDFLNAHFQGRIHVLDERFHCHVGVSQESLFRPLRDYGGKILHYSGKIKPLNGDIAPGLVPFWVHAHRAP